MTRVYTHRDIDWTNSQEKNRYKRMMVNAKDPYYCECCNKYMIYRNKRIHFKTKHHIYNQAIYQNANTYECML